MRRLDVLINQARLHTDNLQYSATAGLQQEEFVQWANNAQDHLQGAILMQHPAGSLEVSKDIITQMQTAAYPIPFDAYLGSRVDSVFYSPTGNEIDFYPLKKRLNRERSFGLYGSPQIYVPSGKNLILVPAPNGTGTLRVFYQQALPRMDLRRGTVAAVTLDTVNRKITSLTLTTGTSLDYTNLINDQYLTIVDLYGNQQMRKIPFTAINQGTGVVTVDPNFVYDPGETIAVNQYVCRGANASTNSQLPDACERYFIKFMEKAAQSRDSSSDQVASDADLMKIEAEIIASYGEPDGDVETVAILDGSFVDMEPF